ncbi:V-type ATPase [Reticulomyxa filosa]|uniref:V-type proton ATPase subunit a n=1 Tax=Reticulomyxa filosa TaxID=46433 RepID=X6MD79_RETFI|nr:V-type ATPase [Reticulomyxa filosa]|eukprot:ETO11968.1 V-type ATPase [Reticulomyxa filosa]
MVRDKGKGTDSRYNETNNCPFKGSPSTYFEENELIAAFQAIVDTYGMPRYKEFNPVIPTVITFPFLFGVMYGDMFHGSCLLLFALCLLLAGKLTDLSQSDLSSLYSARYVLLLMGVFALYCGVIYNDCMSVMVNGWNGSQWQHGYTTDDQVVMVQRNVYAVGIDPAWSGVDNQLSFANSLKMKLAVIIGVIQMTFGLFLKLSNHIQENDFVSVWFEFIPQMVFMMCFFGYMVFLIFYKWCINWASSTLSDMPSIITILIKMFLSPGSVDSEVQIFGDKNLQVIIQVTFLLALVLSIPIMLCVKPCILRSRMANHNYQNIPDDEKEETEVQLPVVQSKEGEKAQKSQTIDEESKQTEHEDSKDTDSHHSTQHGQGHEHESFGDIMIHQLIHTIEYVLGTISNTASYLRLWALSLAHAELSEVFFDKTLRMTLESTGVGAVIMNVASAAAFLSFTCTVLLIMDVLECFLHALRLHWVEFQSKFFYADGKAFRPFAFEKLLKAE